ncbi:MAG TPA: arginine repressor [Bacteroidales bacterium]|nr:arginine repressor [Bacteroidales bacterium]
MQKISRLLTIERIIEKEEISSQEELVRMLKKEGISCTQATLSRNLRQIGVMRVPNGKGGYRYSLTGNIKQPESQGSLINIVSVIRSMIDANSMIVMKTRPGYANSVAVMIDNSDRFEIAGTIAGDDTLLIIPRDNVKTHHLHDCLELIFPGLHKGLKEIYGA